MKPLLQAEHLSKHFSLGGGKKLVALHDVSLDLFPGETLGVVGESGCGKSTLARTLMGVWRPTAGNVLYRGQPLKLRNRRARLAYARQVQMVFQDPYASLDPRMTVADILTENLALHGLLDRAGRLARAGELLELVGLERAHLGRFPHEFSGGQRQRVGIARALAVDPACIICDEPVSALDLSVQSQVVNLLKGLQRDLGLAYVFIAHDLNIVRHLSQRIAVMYLGRVVELGESNDICAHPLHPYTQLLLSAVLTPQPGKMPSVPPSMAEAIGIPVYPSVGCSFAGRCPFADSRCRCEYPALRLCSENRLVACHHA